MNYTKCLLCEANDATKTNSHIIPSFLVAQVCSYDGSGQRDKEVMFTMTPYEEKVYTGQVPSTKYEELFDINKLSDNRIERELKDNTVSKNFIFCPVCEKRFSDYLETPYASYYKQGENISSDIQYMFWVSIVWRLSVSGQFAFRLSHELEESLRIPLLRYFEAKEKGKDFSDIVLSCPMRYRLLDAKDSKNKAGFIGGRYNYDWHILSYTIGNLILVASFSDELPDNYVYYGFEKIIKRAHVNFGIDSEQVEMIEKADFDNLIKDFVRHTAKLRFVAECKIADACWQAVGLSGEMPGEIKRVLIERLYSEEVKQGDRHSKERYVELFNEVLQSFGYKPK